MSKNRHVARHRATPQRVNPIQSASRAASAAGRPAAVVVAASGILLGAALPASAGATAPAPQAAAATGSYTVKSGDTLGSIASSNGVSLTAVFAANGLNGSSIIYPGQSIALAGSAAVAAPAAPQMQAAAFTAPAPAPVAAPAAAVGPTNTGITTQTVGFKPISAAAQAPAGSKAATIAAAAKGQVGIGQDCTKLVSNALAAAGVNFHDWPAGYLGLGAQVSAAAAVPGDLIYYSNGGAGVPHIAVYIGGGQAIHGGFNGGQTVQAPAEIGTGGTYIRVG
ncbi:LysM peptidoglycan-binding domain-containing protein [Arthrobacter sp. Br18]|uniref:C40 family peptidase n=1 Tax=Arthrobacter sp. Br18 TaxID=1312954 RepID=UPI00047BB49E|nr:LysM peptidoglycan-binding domain-containing protein [Arthrobacter sp. Br18]